MLRNQDIQPCESSQYLPSQNFRQHYTSNFSPLPLNNPRKDLVPFSRFGWNLLIQMFSVRYLNSYFSQIVERKICPPANRRRGNIWNQGNSSLNSSVIQGQDYPTDKLPLSYIRCQWWLVQTVLQVFKSSNFFPGLFWSWLNSLVN